MLFHLKRNVKQEGDLVIVIFHVTIDECRKLILFAAANLWNGVRAPVEVTWQILVRI
jgi:hypothetical protein